MTYKISVLSPYHRRSMRVIEHRRHSRRDPGSVHLSSAGVELARRLGPTLGRFDRAVSSPKPRAIETVEALGFPLDATIDELAILPDDAGLAMDAESPRTFADYVRLVGHHPEMTRYAHRQAALMRSELEQVPEGGRLLMISHAGVLEFGAAACRPSDARTWGATADVLEGVRLTLDRSRWVRGEVLRVTV